MICYKDMTFCLASDCKLFDGCTHALTDEVRRNAQKSCLPMSIAIKLRCFEPKPESDEPESKSPSMTP